MARAWQRCTSFSSVRLRTRVTKGPGSKAAGLATAFTLLGVGPGPLAGVNGPQLVALGRRRPLRQGVMVERPDKTQEAAA
jgi:putative transposase